MKSLKSWPVIISACALLLVGFIKPRQVNLQDLPKVDRWATSGISEQQKKVKLSKDPLMRAGLSQALGDWENCIRYSKEVPAKNSVRDWVLVIQLSCARQLAENPSKTKKATMSPVTALKEAIKTIEKNLDDWKYLRSGKKLQQDVVDAEVSLCKWLDEHSQWKELRTQIQKAFREEEVLSKSQRAQIYFFAGDLLVAERQWSDAYWQYHHAKELGSTDELNSKLKAILPMLPVSTRQQIESQILVPKPEESTGALIASAEETEQFNQAQNYLSRNDTRGAIESLAKLLKSFPLGVNSKWAQDKLFEMLVQEIDRSKGPSGESVAKRRIEKVMREFDPERQAEWGKALFDLQYYSVAAPLLKKSADQGGGSPRSAKAYFLAARAFQLSQNYPEAKNIFRTLVKNYPLASEVTDAALQWALINYNENDPSEAITHLEIVRARKMTSQQDLTSLFWLFQSYKLKKADLEMQNTANELIRKFPLTYYGLIAYQELNKGLPTHEKQPSRNSKLYFSESELKALDRARILLQSGILNYANEELAIFSNRDMSPDEGQYLANFYAQSLHYQKAFSLLNSGYEDIPERKNEFIIHELFPKEYWEYVTDDTRRSDLDPLLLLSVMKQESAFDFQAVSRSGAVGLLQMIPPTAEEVKRELNSNEELPHDLFDPATNVRYCAHYLANMIKKYNGSIPLALAAYNAGPKRINMFMNSRVSLTDTWVDELPWSEPSFYVKSILKNYIMYRMLYAGLTQLPSPPWANSLSSSSK